MPQAMEHAPHIERRLTDLEIKASFSEDLLDELNTTVFRQQQQIALLMEQIAQLRRQFPDASSGRPGISSGSRDELPPHY